MSRSPPTDVIQVRGARVHNLCDVDVDLPLGRFLVLSGVSGSGKSSLAVDVLFAESRRRYLESLSARVRQNLRQLEPPEVDSIDGLPPMICLDQRTSPPHPRSTLATVTEIADYLRLLHARAGRAHCPGCGRPVSRQTPQEIADRILTLGDRLRAMLLAPVVRGRKGEHRAVFERIVKDGFVRARVDGAVIDAADPPKLARGRAHTIEVVIDRIVVKEGIRPRLLESVQAALRHGDGACVVSVEESGGWRDLLFSERFACADCGLSYPELEPRTFSFNSPQGACPQCAGAGTLDDGPTGEATCPACGGARLNPFARCVTVAGVPIHAVYAMTVDSALTFFRSLENSLSPGSPGEREWTAPEAAVIGQLVPEIVRRLDLLGRVGLEYLALGRAAATLSGGEFQRARLASSLGAGLTGVCYLLDEPTIGLHPRDTSRLLDALLALRDQGATLLAVEHDPDVIRRADRVFELGPGAGADGGRLISEGSPDDLARDPHSVTGPFLRAEPPSPRARRPVDASHPAFVLSGARRHNLRGVTLRVPHGRLVCVTGVSGSGKSTLVLESLAPALRQVLAGQPAQGEFDQLVGVEPIGRLVEVDQQPLGRSARSNPATYSGLWGEFRKLFAKSRDARLRGFGSRRFSPSDLEGRCPDCRGLGTQRVRLGFLPDLIVTCPACRGARFNRQTLAVRFAGRSAADVLAMRFDEAAEAFGNLKVVSGIVRTFVDVGLGYLTLGQPAGTLSGGEAQRVRLASELCRAGETPTLFLLDEPTTGLHPADVERLLAVLERLVDQGHTVVVIEHHLGVIAACDWVIDLGPGGGPNGGAIVAEGPPEAIARTEASPTGRALGPR